MKAERDDVPLELLKEFAGIFIAVICSVVAAAWVWIVMFFDTRSSAVRAHARIDALEKHFDVRITELALDLRRLDVRLQERDQRIEDKLDRLIERGAGQ